MKKYFILMCFLCFFTQNFYGQMKKFEDIPNFLIEQMQKMGCDTNSLLTELEGAYFNIFFQNYRKDFDFREKK